MTTVTTGAIAEIVGVSSSKANDWFDNGLLNGSRIPNSTHRRVLLPEALEFLEKYDVPMGQLEAIDGENRTFILSHNTDFIEAIRSEFDTDCGEAPVVAYNSTFTMAVDFASRYPRVLVLDTNFLAEKSTALFEKIQTKLAKLSPLTAIIIVNSSKNDNRNDTLHDPSLVANQIKTTIDTTERYRIVKNSKDSGISFSILGKQKRDH